VKKETEYRYRKRLDELKRENEALRVYRSIVFNITEEVAKQVGNNEYVGRAWLIREIKRALR